MNLYVYFLIKFKEWGKGALHAAYYISRIEWKALMIDHMKWEKDIDIGHTPFDLFHLRFLDVAKDHYVYAKP